LTGSDIAPCNRHHLELAKRVREGIAFEFPIHPIQETLKRPTAALDRNLQYLSLVEILYGYPIILFSLQAFISRNRCRRN
jgi:dihydroxy-acid dehydratase